MTANKYDKKIIIKFIIHHIIMMIMVIIMVFAVAYAYYIFKKQNVEMPMPKSEKTNGKSHPLPDFIVDKIKPDELGDLKP